MFMTFNLTVVQKPDHLHVIVTGQNRKENAIQYLDAICAECEARGCFKVLIEERFEGPRFGMVDIFRIVAQRSNKVFGLFKAIAYVDKKAEGILMRFAETVAVNRGLPLAVFKRVADAENWLLHGNRAPADP
jgi:hypothetical protein